MFIIGQVVRIKLDGKCQIAVDGRKGHPKIYHGQIGVVVNVVEASHPYLVATFEHKLFKKVYHMGGLFTESELVHETRTFFSDNEWEKVRYLCNQLKLPLVRPIISYTKVSAEKIGI